MNDSPTEKAKAITWVGLLVNVALIGIKLVAGLVGNSQALIADAVHSVSDLFTDVIVLVGLRLGRKPPDDSHHFGHARIETLASAVVGLALIATALVIGIHSFLSIYHQKVYRPTTFALLAAGVSIVFKEALYRFTIYAGRRINSQLVIANAWHHRSDALSSVAVLLGVSAALINPSWYLLDSFAAALVSFFIIKVGLEIFGGAVRELSDAAPSAEVLEKIQGCASNVRGVMDSHDLRVRTTGGRLQIEIHIVVDAQWTVEQGHRVAKSVEQCLLQEVGDVERVIVHTDPSEK